MTTTAQTAEQPPVEAPPFQVAPKTGTKLEHLHAIYADAKAKADGATEDLKAITDAIKVELANVAPEQTRVELVGTAGPTLRMSYIESWRVDSRKLKAEDPETYVRYAKKTGSWTLKPVSTQGGKS